MRICTASKVQSGLAMFAGLLLCATRVRAVTIVVGSASGGPGSTTTFGVTLSSMGSQVGGIINEIHFDPAAPIAQCTVFPPLATLSSWKLLPQGCTPLVDCEYARFVIISFQPIPDGPLYSCDVQIAANAAAGGTLALTCAAPSASGPRGTSLTAECTDGHVQVVVPGSDTVCDVSDDRGDNVGQFGDGTVDILDVRAIFAAAQLGVDTPADGSARFSAMDSSTPDNPPACGGDQTLDILDVRQCFAVAQLGATNYTRTGTGGSCTSTVAPQ